MTVYKIKSRVLRAERQKVESVNRAYIDRRLAEVQKRDPEAKLLIVGEGR